MTRATNSDARLLQRAAKDPEAFDELYRRYEPIVAGFLYRRTGNAEATADLTADTFVTAITIAHRFSDRGQPAIGWLIGIARNKVMRFHERKTNEQRAIDRLRIELPVLSPATIDEIENVCSPAGPFERALAELPELQQAAIRALVIDEQSYSELSDALGVPEATLRQRVSRGLARIRTQLVGSTT